MILRSGLLEGVRVVVAGAGAFGAAVEDRCAALGANCAGEEAAPPLGDAHAEAARAGLENMARTLSIEWARRGIRPVAIHPCAATSPADVAELVAFLASPAGGYYSGCRFELGSS